MVEVSRFPVVEFANQLVKLLFSIGRALQQEEHVIDAKAVRDRAAIILAVRLRSRVAEQLHPIVFVDLLSDAIGSGRGIAAREHSLGHGH